MRTEKLVKLPFLSLYFIFETRFIDIKYPICEDTILKGVEEQKKGENRK